MRIILTFLAFLLAPYSVFALDLIYPAHSEPPTQSSPLVLMDSFFQWGRVNGADKYVLDVQPFNESIDNISPTRCSGDGKCTFPFLEMPSGRNIQYASRYTWSVTAFDSAGNPIGGPSNPRSFTTEQAPVGTPPPGQGGTTPQTLENPIPGTRTLTELFNKIFSFLFGLSIFIVPIIVIYAAFLILMGGGDPVKLQKGRMILLWTAVAFIIILLSRGLPIVFRNLL